MTTAADAAAPEQESMMTAPARDYDPIRFHRGTRWFAAVVTAFSGVVVLALATLVAPTLPLERSVAAWVILGGTVTGIAHLVAAVALLRGRRWGAELVGYLAAIGITLSLIAALMTATDLDPFHVDRGTAIGVALYLSFWWLVAVRYAVRPFTFERPWSAVGGPVPSLLPAARRKAVQAPAPARRREPPTLYPISTPTA